ncbi:MAG: lysine biosynthesis protein LysX [Synergistaceae bacterium]|jgi:[lysine-biosynthesis-protein LysW]--L-2-aminoadipate ligase|nr:lysine biosynthesis protein LysX [Synergistaceae bacterium]
MGAGTLHIFYSRLRVEEKALLKAAESLGTEFLEASVDFRDVGDLVWPDDFENVAPHDVVLCRCVSQTQNVALTQLLESRGVRVINPSRALLLCGDKIATAALLDKDNIPQPAWRVATFSEGAVKAAESLGYPVVFKPAVGSWGRLLAKISDREACEAIVEHKAHMGPAHSVFFIQEYVEKRGFDLRAVMIGGKTVTLMKRSSEHWITNTARGAKPELYPMNEELENLLNRTAKAIGGDFLAVDVFKLENAKMENTWVINEVNGQPEFHGSVAATGIDVGKLMVEYAVKLLDSRKQEPGGDATSC